MRSLARRTLKSLCRFYPLYGGCITIANTSFFRTLSQTPDPLVMTRLRDGSPIFVRLDDYTSRSIYYFGDHDPKITWVCKKLLRPGDTMLDIGANCGVITISSAKLVGQTGHVHAFEPQPNLAELIQRSAQLGGYSQVSVHNIALSSQDGVMNIQIPLGHSGAASLSRQPSVHRQTREIQIQLKRTTDYLSSLNLQSIRLIKLDVEGHEAEVLQGGLDFFRDCKPDAVVFESNEHKYESNAKPFWEQAAVRLLESIGYDLFEIPKFKFRLRLRKLARGTEPQVSSSDFVAVKHGELYEDIATALTN